jgi:hypothetical protein
MTDYFILKVYFIFLICALFLGIYLSMPHHMTTKYLGINVTRIGNTCEYIWLGGIDYDSFIRDLSVDNVSVGHPNVGTTIHNGNCSAVVRMYMKDVQKYVQLYPKAGGI